MYIKLAYLSHIESGVSELIGSKLLV